uniref:B box-type domain-containing protein n=1 Tax=Magallana gigas TaxID=29159 RepID=A0A8W8IGP0_MAGGI|nr:uncharacterized protein LOC117690546 [Crassostrea gigas]
MDPEYSLQDVVRCHLCETPVPPLHCVICSIHLCKTCVEKHLSDESKEHKIVSFKYRRSTPKCQNHLTRICELYCENCNIPMCALCFSSEEHQTHDVVDILKSLESKTSVLQNDLKELEERVYPNLKEIASNYQEKKTDLDQNSKKLSTSIHKQGEELHREIDIIIEKMISDLNEMHSKYISVLRNQEHEITHTIYEITKSIADLKKLLNSNDDNQILAYKSRNADFRRLPFSLNVSLPSFTPTNINNEYMFQLFGSLSALTIETKSLGYTTESMNIESSSPDRPFIDVPRIIIDIKTDYGHLNKLLGVTCLSDEEIWTCGGDNIVRLYNLHGQLVKSIHTASGNMPYDIALTKCGKLVYTDNDDKTVNIVKNTQIQTVIRLQGWNPLGVCSTSSGDLLVVMDNDKCKQTKVVRYSGTIEKQIVQYNVKGHSFYSYDKNSNIKYIAENRNLDICVSDNKARSVVVVNQAGKLRFTYTGPPSTTTSTKGSFYPVGITIDTHSRMLITDCYNHRIHILDHDGQFLRYIDKCQLRGPWGLCVDNRDSLFVADHITGQVRKIKYNK